MVSFLLAPENFVFSICLSLLSGLLILELIGLFAGMSVFGFLDNLLPDVDLPDTSPVETGGAWFSVLGKAFGWIRGGPVPFMVTLVLFLAYFPISGLFLQSFFQGIFGVFAPGWAAGGLALISTALGLRYTSLFASRFVIRDESSAISRDTFIGEVAEIVSGTARKGLAAQAKFQDAHGQLHYFLVEPDEPEEVLPAGSRVLVLDRKDSRFIVTKAPFDNPIIS